ncbi:MAG: hypothetical protein IOD05_17120 [Rhodobacter sp.]|nr:hypothetical protein [Rhodobacter sp.]MCA3494562.1 hypothetical protein [Rhodobacter sp.]MCA3500912.1 hypothetical protein [Rhodobacter sp.]MCA3504935.1 hypothetical protein [Rhodobacter sp.]MCA3516643.1 hypothetical protein [Rhodobacter sp.]
MRRIVWLLLVLMLGAGAAAAQDGAKSRRAVVGEPCPVALPDWASDPEKFAWEQICAGNVADMQYSTGADDGAGCDAVKEDQPWPDSRVLSPRFIKLISAREPFVSVSARTLVALKCARFDEAINLAGEVVPVGLAINSSRIYGDMFLAETRFEAGLSFYDSILFEGIFNAVGANVLGGLQLVNSSFTGAYFLYSTVDGNFDTTDSSFSNSFNAYDMRVTRNVFMGNSFKDVDLSSVVVGGNLIANGSRFAGSFMAEGLSVGEYLKMVDGASFAEVDLSDASVGGSFDLDGATVSGSLDAQRLKVEKGIFLHDSEFAEVSLEDAKVGSVLSLDGSRFRGDFNAGGIQVDGGVDAWENVEFSNVQLLDAEVKGGVYLGGAKVSGLFIAGRSKIGGTLYLSNAGPFNEVNLQYASIGGSLNAIGSKFTGDFTADGVKVANDIFLRSPEEGESGFSEGVKTEFATVRLLGALVGGDITADGALFSGPLKMSSMKVDGLVSLSDNAQLASVDIVDSTIGGSLAMSGSSFSGPVDARGLKVGGSVFLRDKAEFAEVRLPGASVGWVVQMQESTFAGPVNMTGLAAQELALWQGAGSTVNWGKDATLTLRNAHVAALQARIPESWVRADGTPLPLDLQGFRYDRLGGVGSGAEGDLSRIGDAAPLIAWIEAAGDSGGQAAGHAPQPYFQMESVLRTMGAEPAADEVAYARHLHRMDHYGNTLQDWVAWAREWVWRLLVGFGVYPFRLLWWFTALVVLGTILGRRTSALCTQGWSGCFWYSLENAFPLMEPGRRNRDLFHDHPAVRSFFHFQKIAGFVLGTILVGTLTLLGN